MSGKEFEDIIKDLDEKLKHYKEKMESLKLERGKFIQECFLGKNLEELNELGIFTDRGKWINRDFIYYIKQKEKLTDIILKRRFRKEIMETNTKARTLRELRNDSMGVLCLYLLSTKYVPITELSIHLWKRVEDVLILIKKHIRDFIVQIKQNKLNQLAQRVDYWEKNKYKKEE
jgi:hypothetical protein